jgi:hypothetical protein
MGPEGCKLAISSPRAGALSVEIYNLRGEKVRELSQFMPAPGTTQLSWDARNFSGAAVAYGAYFVLLKLDGGGGSDEQGIWLSVAR